MKNLLCLIALSLSCIVCADDFANRVATIPFADDFEDAAVIGDFMQPESHVAANNPTSVMIYYDKEAVRLRITAFQPSIGGEQFIDTVKKNESDAVEILLMPPGSAIQYHLLVTPSGKRWTLREDWKKLNSWDLKGGRMEWQAPEVLSSVDVHENEWVVDATIPFAAMERTAPPKDGEEWRANFCRNVATRGQELAGWGLLGSPHFQKTDYFGKVIFRENAPTVSSIRVTPEKITADVKAPSGAARTVEVSRVLQSGAAASPQDRQTFALEPGKQTQIQYDKATSSRSLLWAEVKENGRLLAKHCSLPTSTFISLGFADPENVRTQTVYLATDIPFYISWKMNHNLPSTGYRSMLYRDKKKVDCVLEVPEGVNLTGLIHDASAYGWNQSPRIVPTVKDVLYEGRKYKQYTFPLHMIINWDEPQWLFFYECSLPAGKEFSGRLFFMIDDKPECETVKHYRTIKVGKVKRTFSHLPYNIGLMDAVTLINWLPKDTLKHYTSLGFNCVSVPVRPMVSGEFYKGDAPKTPEDFYDLLYQEFLKADFPIFMNTVSVSTGAPAHAWTRADLPGTVAIDKHGKKLTKGGYQGSPALCFSYRGEEYQKWINRLVTSSAFGKYKVTWLTLDMELFSEYAFENACYCDNCLRLYKEYCIRHDYNDMAELDPRTATGDKFKKVWREYQTFTAEEFVLNAVNAVREKVNGAKSTSPWGEFTSQDYGIPGAGYKNDSMNFFEMSVYHPAEGNYKKLLDTTRNVFGVNSGNVATGLSYGQTGGCPDWQLVPEDCKESIYEVMIFGTKNVVYYFYTYLEPLRMSKIVEAMNVVVPFEDIILEGKITDDAKASSQEMLLTHRTRGDESLLAVRSYYAKEKVKGTITLGNVAAPMNVYDCETGAKIGSVSPKKPSFKYSIDRKDCRLLFLGSKEQWKKRHK